MKPSQVYIFKCPANVRIVDIFLKIVDNVDIVVNIPTLLFNESAISLVDKLLFFSFPIQRTLFKNIKEGFILSK